MNANTPTRRYSDPPARFRCLLANTVSLGENVPHGGQQLGASKRLQQCRDGFEPRVLDEFFLRQYGCRHDDRNLHAGGIHFFDHLNARDFRHQVVGD
jgi:hypothetical protein